MTALAAYHALVRSFVRGSTSAPRAGQGASVYAALVRLQHRQPLVQVYGSARSRDGGGALERLIDAFVEAHPPADVHPGRWAIGFGQLVCEREDLPIALREHVDFLALQLAQSLLPDDPDLGTGTWGEVRAYTQDPRSEAPSGGAVVLVFRSATGLVRVLDADAATIGAWGLAIQQCTASELAARGIHETSLETARAALRGAGHARFA